MKNDLKSIYMKRCLDSISKWEELWKIAKEVSDRTAKTLQVSRKDWIAWMADLELIDPNKELWHVDENCEGNYLSIHSLLYRIVNTENQWDLPDGNYYNLWTKKFVVVYNNWINLLEYSPYTKNWKEYERGVEKVLWKDNLMIKWFIWKIWDILSEEINKDSKTGVILDYISKYKGMIWRYNMGIWYFEWEVKNKYGSDDYTWFEWIWRFQLDSWVVLVGDFNVEHYLDWKKIFWIWKIIYPNKKEEIGSWWKEAGLIEKVYKIHKAVRGSYVDWF